MEEKRMEKKISTGLKVWLWLVIIANGWNLIKNVMAIGDSPLAAIFSIVVEGVMIYGAVLIMFKTKKLGFKLMCIAVGVNAVLSIILMLFVGVAAGAATGSAAVGVASSVIAVMLVIIGAIFNPLITYLLMKKDWDMFE